MTDTPAGPPDKTRFGLPRRPLGPVGTWVALFIVAAFVLNYWVASRSLSQPLRIRIPYSPLFVQEVRAGNVDRITSKGTSIQGDFAQAISYPPSHPKRATHFETEIPSFADTKELSALLQEHNVVLNAEPLQRSATWWERLLYGFGPTLVLILLLVLLMRRGAGRVFSSFGRSRARRYKATAERVTFDDVAGIDEAKAELTEIVDFL